MSVTLFLVVVALGWLLVLQLERMGKLKAERHAILLLFKTEHGKGFIERVSRFKRFWKVFGSAGILIGILGMVLVVFTLVFAVYSTYFIKKPVEGATFVIPGVTIPFWYGIIGLITVLVVHEFAHGILARAEDVPIKNMGAIFVTIIPIGAFVEPDEDELKAKERVPRMRVYAAGPFGNILLSIFAILPLILFIGYFFDTSIVEINGVVEDSPAFGVLEEGMVLKEINGKAITGPEDFQEATRELEPGDEVVIETDVGTFTIMASEKAADSSKGFIGIWITSPQYGGIPAHIYGSLYWIAILNQGIGLINMAPLHLGIAATDGHYILNDMLSKFKIKDTERVTLAVSKTVLLVLVLVLLGPVYSDYFGV
jgi:membrane-associated protease RseP (regulator of RpoE activity)